MFCPLKSFIKGLGCAVRVIVIFHERLSSGNRDKPFRIDLLYFLVNDFESRITGVFLLNMHLFFFGNLIPSIFYLMMSFIKV